MTDATREAVARRYRALAEPARIRLLEALHANTRLLSVTELARALGLSVPAASRHASLLHSAGFVKRQRVGGRVVHRLTSAGERVVSGVASVAGEVHDGTEDDASEDVASGPRSLAEENAELVYVCLAIGATLLNTEGADRAAWEWHMVEQFGEHFRPHLGVLRAAALRIFRREPFDGLPLPEEVLRSGVAAFAGSAWRGARPIPDR